MKRSLKIAASVIVFAGFTVAGYTYWHHREYYPSTDDAYVGAHVIRVAPRVSGRIVAVDVHDHQRVTAGETLYRIDPTTFALQVKEARARLELAKQHVAALQAAVSAARADVSQAEVRLANAESRARRQQALAKRGYTNTQAVEDATDAARAARAALAVAQANLQQALAQQGPSGHANGEIRSAEAALGIAESNLSDTTVKAACDGTLSQLSLRPGDSVTLGQPNFVLVCGRHWWVDANYKETDLARIHPGQSATVTVDMYPDHSFHGRVVSINPASGAAFSLLPPENATGNWVKVTQRVPVRVEILDTDPRYPLRVGTSAEVTVDTVDKPAAGTGRASP
ncbi:HlyD family secretion protein [Acidihalobacter prosperus]|uniref:Secretion protein HlyD n=1 Tax=Acidihalobacter prosperus TaxID=160660 RepID=A0A1A6C4P3_9GAMM|nr:HlyD family secretion protein [Acidihalobacter prosperus]OBS09536.1 hypothetical protein Thpro_021864 [Acidihalobacter prosperus]